MPFLSVNSSSASPLSTSEALSSKQKLSKLDAEIHSQFKKLKENAAKAANATTATSRPGGFISISLESNADDYLYSEKDTLQHLADLLKKTKKDLLRYKELAEKPGQSSETKKLFSTLTKELPEVKKHLQTLKTIYMKRPSEKELFNKWENEILPALDELKTEIPTSVAKQDSIFSMIDSLLTSILKKIKNFIVRAQIQGLWTTTFSLHWISEKEIPNVTNTVQDLLKGNTEHQDNNLREEKFNKDGREKTVNIPELFSKDLNRSQNLIVNKKVIYPYPENKDPSHSRPPVGELFYNLMTKLEIDEKTLQHIGYAANQASLAEPCKEMAEKAKTYNENWIPTHINDAKLGEDSFKRIKDSKNGDKIIYIRKVVYECKDLEAKETQEKHYVAMKTTLILPLAALHSDSRTLPPEEIGKGVHTKLTVTGLKSTPEEAFQELNSPAEVFQQLDKRAPGE